MKLNTIKVRGKPVSPWMSMPILLLVMGLQEEICTTILGTKLGPEGRKERKGERKHTMDVSEEAERHSWGL